MSAIEDFSPFVVVLLIIAKELAIICFYQSIFWLVRLIREKDKRVLRIILSCLLIAVSLVIEKIIYEIFYNNVRYTYRFEIQLLILFVISVVCGFTFNFSLLKLVKLIRQKNRPIRKIEICGLVIFIAFVASIYGDVTTYDFIDREVNLHEDYSCPDSSEVCLRCRSMKDEGWVWIHDTCVPYAG